MVYYTFICSRQDLLLYLHKSLLCHTMKLKDVIKQRRETLSLTQQDLAEMAQVGLATIKDIERGKGNPALNTVKKILQKVAGSLKNSMPTKTAPPLRYQSKQDRPYRLEASRLLWSLKTY